MTKFQRNKNRRERKGVVLLIIVTLLTLLVLIGLALSVVAINFRDSGEKVRAAGTYGDLPDKEMDMALGQLLYGSNQFTAAISPHNLLADLYGHDGVAGTITGVSEENPTPANPQQQGQVIKIAYTDLNVQQPFGRTFSPLPHYYSGRVLTFTDGTATGFSTRVMAYLPNAGGPPNTGTLYVEAIESDLPVKVLPTSGNRFLINGAPFNGTGFGYLDSTYNVDMDELGGDATSSGQPPVALVGNFGTLPTAVGFSAATNPDEPWDAADLNNWHLSVVPPAIGQAPLPIIPSFHRPELIHYWLYQVNPAGGNINQIPLDRLRKISLRPIGAEYGANADHFNFTGGNPNYHPINGPWDVDNDGDGIADSIWVDLGLPAVTGKDGRKYKRLFAFLIKDLDGRLNVNVHGNLSQTVPQYRADVGALPYGGGGLARGLGFGVAEVDLQPVFGAFSTPTARTANSALLVQRYGADNFPGAANLRDPFNWVKHHGTPDDYLNQFSWYTTPPDVWGRGALTLDGSGNPQTVFMGQTNEMLDNPYEIHAGRYALNADLPYGVAEMEALLRYHDPSAVDLGSRLFNSGSQIRYLNSSSPGVLGDDHRRREVLSTHTRFVPVSMARAPREFFTVDPLKPGSAMAVQFIQNQNKRNPSLLDLYTYKLIRDTGMAETDPYVQTALNKIVPFEVRQGHRFNVNRFLGDGADNDNSGVPDDYPESGSGSEPAWLPGSGAPQTFQGAIAWHVNDTDVDNNGAINTTDLVLSRHLYARHLFCLLMLLWDEGYLPPLIEVPAPTAVEQRELAVRKLAQFAINAVDFRDADAVMTPFEYDVNPFNGWDVDGSLLTNPSSANPDPPNPISGQDERRIVWGVEYPDLVITETKAMHNRRVRDTANDTSGQLRPNDEELDQLRRPQGSLFIELFCPRKQFDPNDANRHRLPLELYSPITLNLPGGSQPRFGLSLDKMAQPSADGQSRPVWRIAISMHTRGDAQATNTPIARSINNPDTTSFQPENMSLTQPITTPGQPPELPLDRFVWFSSVAPTAGYEAGRTYVNLSGWDAHVQPQQYAVVGPRPTTYVGSTITANPIVFAADSPQGIQLQQINHYIPNSTGVTVTDLSGATNPMIIPGATVKGVVGLVADMMPPALWTNQALRVGLSITEPLPTIDGFYYDEPLYANEGYDDLAAPTNLLLDRPFDERNVAMGDLNDFPLFTFNMLASDTYPDVRAVFLQRLANPNAAWDAIYNPYITVDWSSIDCTVFAGDEDTNRQVNAMPIDPVDPGPTAAGNLRFGTRQKGEPWGDPLTANLWSHRTAGTPTPQSRWPQPQTTAAAGLTTTYWDYNLVHTLGYINANLGTPMPENPGTQYSEAGDPFIIGIGSTPFPWLTHLDRPLSSPMELLLVSCYSQGQLLHMFQPLPPPSPGPQRTFNPYNQLDPNFAAPFSHLLNFFQTGNPGPGAPAKISPQLARLLEYLEVPCPFSGTEKWFNPGNTNQHFGDPAASGTVAYMYRPPFNRLSRFADPGRININTVYDQKVLEGVFSQLPTHDPNANTGGAINPYQAIAQQFVNRLILSRQGYGDRNPANFAQSALAMDQRYPTRFANPFRPADFADLMPAIADMRRLAPAEGTLMRSDYFMDTGSNPPPGPVPPPTPTPTPLFDAPNATNTPPAQIYNYNDPNRNAYFEYQAYQKIGNVFSTQSNVYAVWITVGYFEVEENRPAAGGPIQIDIGHPDGYRLGQEVGADSGNTVRHRSFAIIDRSVPAAYEPGKRHNTDKMILLRRFIE